MPAAEEKVCYSPADVESWGRGPGRQGVVIRGHGWKPEGRRTQSHVRRLGQGARESFSYEPAQRASRISLKGL